MSEKYLTAEQIVEISRQRPLRTRTDSKNETDACAYCGAQTKMLAYTDLENEKSWPPCCSKPECIDRWEPLQEMIK